MSAAPDDEAPSHRHSAGPDETGWLHRQAPRLARQLQFLIECDRLKSVLRGNRLADGSRRENTAEHSWHLSIFATVLAEWSAKPVDVARVMQMLLIHDLVEIEAGDTPLFAEASADAQSLREREAARKIFGMLPPDQCEHFHALWTEFEAALTPDAQFAKALDRLQPILLNHLSRGGTWLDYAVDEDRERRLTSRIELGAPALWGVAQDIFQEAVRCGWLLPSRRGSGCQPPSGRQVES